MALAPEISAFGDGDHNAGATGLTVDGGGFGAFPGSLWIYENSDRTGNADELTVGTWNDIALSGVDIPSVLNNSTGTRYLFLQREDLAWSNALAFTLFSGLNVSAETAELTLTSHQATVSRDRDVSATAPALEVTTHAATITTTREVVATGAITLTAHAATVARGSDRIVACQTEAISASAQAATVGRDRGVLAEVAEAEVTGHAATIATSRAVSTSAVVIEFQGQAALVMRGRRSDPPLARTFVARKPHKHGDLKWRRVM